MTFVRRVTAKTNGNLGNFSISLSLVLSDTKHLVLDFLIIVFKNTVCSYNEKLSIRGQTRTDNDECLPIHVSLRKFDKTTMAAETEAWLNKRLMNRTMTVHVRYNSWYISLTLPSFAKQQREMTKFCVVWRT